MSWQTIESAMNLQIRDPLAHQLAQRLAKRRKISMTEAVILALQAELEREGEATSLSVRLAVLARDLQAKSGAGGRILGKDEIDALWGHS